LSREHERAFLANVGPLALETAALGRRSRELSRETKAPQPAKRQRRRVVAPRSVPAISPPMAPLPKELAIVEPGVIEHGAPLPDDEAIDAFASLLARGIEPSFAEIERADVAASEAIDPEVMLMQDDVATIEAPQASYKDLRNGSRVNVMERVRGWLRRAG
jgi:8-oxo-dGTP diphosphatase